MALNLSPLLNKCVPRLTLRRTATKSSRRSWSCSLKPMGMHSSRKLQLEQATLMAWGCMVYLLVTQWICLGSRSELKPKQQTRLSVNGFVPKIIKNR
jgi:hypothetical protein